MDIIVKRKKSTPITIDVRPKNKFHSALQKMRIVKCKVIFFLGPFNISTTQLIADQIKLMPESTIRKGIEAILDRELLEIIANIIAIALQNNNKPAKPDLVKFVKHNFDEQEILKVLNLIAIKLDYVSLAQCIITIKGLDILTPIKRDLGLED